MNNREVIQKFHSPDSRVTILRSSRLPNRQIFSAICGIRARLLSQEYKKNQVLARWAYQVIPCVELIKVPANECPCTPQTGCIILRSKYKIPAVVAGSTKHILLVTGLEGRIVLTETSFNTKKWAKGNRFTSDKPDFFLTGDGYLYVTVTTKLETVRLEGVFADPVEAYKYPSSCREPQDTCISNLDYPFPYEEDLIPALVQLTVEELSMFSNKVASNGRAANTEQGG